MSTTPASDAQLRYLDGLTVPDRLARLTSAEARYLIAWLRGPPTGMTRAQQLYLLGMTDKLTRTQTRTAIDLLRGLVEPAAPATERLPR